MAGEHTSVTVVMIGQFKPQEFLPNKLAEAKIISKNDADSASFVALLPDEVVHFNVGWGELLVAKDRFQFTSKEAPFIRVCDFALKSLGELSPKSIVTSFGVNVDCHYDLQSPDARNAFGTRLAPPSAWGNWGAAIAASMTGEHKGTVLQGGVVHIQMQLPFSENGLNGRRTVEVGPSLVIPNNTGVLFRSNHHHQIEPVAENGDRVEVQSRIKDGTSVLLKALSDRFEKSVDDAYTIFEGALKS